MMDRGKFFGSLRSSSAAFGTSLSQAQVAGTEAILDACQRHGIDDGHHVANILAQCYHETAGAMQPIKETVMRHHKDRNPSDATVIARLDRAFANGQLPWVRTPYWRDGWFGRGFIQLTHKANYTRMGQRLGVDLVGNPSRAMDLATSADIAVVGMSEGMFTGRKLADYRFPQALHSPAQQNPRRIVNGADGTDAPVTRLHRAFFDALQAGGGWRLEKRVQLPGMSGGEAIGELPGKPYNAPAPSGGLWALLARLFGGRK